MNKCFFIGYVIEVGRFRFILNSETKYKSEIIIKIKLLDGNIINAVGYDDIADYILRNNFLTKTVLVQGRLKCESKEIQIVINYIEKTFLEGEFAKNEKK